jgi:iron complex transport system substrate-binding protein
VPEVRFAAILLALVLGTLTSSACGDDSQSSGGGAESEAAKTEPSAFPVTIEHKYGSTTIERAPKRVVVVGLREQDALLALGVVPVATTEWYAEKPGAIFEWARDELGDAKPPVVLKDTSGIQLEKVAAQRPDLIIGIYSGIKKGEYEKLSKLAPVVAQPKGEPDFGSSWQEETLNTGKAIGKPDAARELVAKTEKLIADTAAKHPEFKGQTAANVSDYQGIFLYGRYDVRTRMLEDLGFQFPDELANATPEFGGQLSEERVDLLDVGALLWFAEPPGAAKIRRRPTYSRLDVRKEGRDVFIAEKDRVYDATSFVTVLSMPTLMKELVPRLARAADGDPKTSTSEE